MTLIETLTNEKIRQTMDSWWSGKFQVLSFRASKGFEQCDKFAYLKLIFLRDGEELSEDWVLKVEPDDSLSIWPNE